MKLASISRLPAMKPLPIAPRELVRIHHRHALQAAARAVLAEEVGQGETVKGARLRCVRELAAVLETSAGSLLTRLAEIEPKLREAP